MENSDLSSFIAQGFDKAKLGDAVSLYNIIVPHIDNGTLPPKSHYATGWIIYYAMHQSPDREIMERKKMLARYLKLKVTVPHKLHSMILTEAIRLYKDARTASFSKSNPESPSFSILSFLSLWNLSNLREGDWRRKDHNGKLMGSTVEKLITVCVDEIEDKKVIPDQALLSIIERGMSEFKDSCNLMSQRASVHIVMGEPQKAREMMVAAVLLAQGKFHLWAKLASLVSPEKEPHLHAALLSRALASPGQENMKGRIRLSLASVLAHRNAFPQAQWELSKMKEIYDKEGWHLPPDFRRISNLIPSGTVAADPAPFYKKIAHLANREIFNAIPHICTEKTYHKVVDQTKRRVKGGVAWRVTDSDGNNYWIHPVKFGIDPSLPSGTKVLLRVYNGKPVEATLPQA